MSGPYSPNRDRLVRTARRIEPLLAELVFVGGQVGELLVTNPAAVRIRPTDDVDVIVRAATRGAYHDLQQQLRTFGFEPDMAEGAPLCRVRTRDGLVLDAMPLDPGILGFSNSWYTWAIASAAPIELEPGLLIMAVTAPAFLATKWEAYAGRGGDDPLTSRDLEDILTLVAGRPSIVEEVAAAPEAPRTLIADCTRKLLLHDWAGEIVENAIHDARHVPGLLDRVLARLRAIATQESASPR